MRLTDSQLNYFDSNVLQLELEKKKILRQQVKHLVERLKTKINDDTDVRVVRTYRAGSLRKGTILRPHGEINVDADVVFYLNVNHVDPSEVEQLNDDFKELLISIYPQKVESDFTLQPRTIGVRFVKSGLSVDLVPVMDIPDSGGDGWQPSFSGGDPVRTNTRKQLDFIYQRHLGDADYRTLVRLAKGWRNHQIPEYQEMKKLGSFLIELIMAHVQDTQGVASNIEHGLERFWNYFLESGLRLPITFADHTSTPEVSDDPVVVIDPANEENNVASRITEAMRQIILDRAENAWEQVHIARAKPFKGSTLETWRQVFGQRFRIEEL